MEPARRPRVKICCIASVEEARLAVRYGAAALGLVSEMPSGPGVIPEPTIAAIARQAPPAVASFLLTSKQDAASVAAQQRRLGASTLQLVDRMEPGAYRELREALPGISLVQVIHVAGPESVDEALEVSREVHGILLDSGNPSLAVKELGGTGRVHDWALSRTIRETVDVPVFLAGGLRPDNIGEALLAVRPFGVDLCSGVRTDGRLDETKLARFFDAIDRACADLPRV